MMRAPTKREWAYGSGALAVIGLLAGNWSVVQAVTSSKLPTASQEQLAQLTGQVQTLSAQLQINATQQALTQRALDVMEQENLQRDLDRMTAQKADVQDRRKLVDAINIIRSRIGYPAIPRP